MPVWRRERTCGECALGSDPGPLLDIGTGEIYGHLTMCSQDKEIRRAWSRACPLFEEGMEDEREQRQHQRQPHEGL